MSLDARAKIIIETVTRQAIADMQKTGQAIRSVGDDTKKQTGVLQSANQAWKSMLVQIGVVTAALYTVKKAWDFGREGAEILELRAAFTGLATEAGQSSDAIVRAIQRGADGTIAEMDAIAVATRAMNLNIARTPEEFEKLANVAETLGDRLGKDTATSINDVSAALTSLMPRAIRSAGITADAEGVWKRYAESIGKTVPMLTDAEKRTALLDDANNRMGAGAVSAADSFDQLQASLADIVASIKTEFAPGLARAAQALATLLSWNRRIKDAFAEHSEEVARNSGSYEEYSQELLRAADAAGYLVEGQDLLFHVTDNMHGAVNKLIQSNYLLTESEYNAARGVVAATDAASGFIPETEEMAAASRAAADALREEERRARDAARAFGLLDQNIANSIESYLDLAKFTAAGGGGLTAVANEIAQAYADGNINLGEMRGLMEEIQIRAINLQVEAGLISFEEAKEQAEDLGLSMETPSKTVAAIRAHLDALRDKTITVTIYERTVRGETGGVSLADINRSSARGRASLADINRQHGGRLSGVNLVGEAGPEMIINGVVVPASITAELLRLGLVPGRRLLTGGVFIDGTTGTGSLSGGTGAATTGAGILGQAAAAVIASTQIAGGGAGILGGGAVMAGSTARGFSGGAAVAAAAAEAASAAVSAEIAPSLTSATLAAQSGVQVAASQIALATQATIAATNEVAGILKEILETLEKQGDADDIGLAVRDGLQQTQG